MIVVEIPPNPNCEAVDMRVFHDLAPARPISQVRLEREAGTPQWCDVTGWTTQGTTCQALAQKIDDSGEGIAFLIYGGDAGLRFRSPDNHASWSVEARDQWGESFLIINDDKEIRIA